MGLLLHLFCGAQVGVAGRTGCGKSTLMMALYRLGKPRQYATHGTAPAAISPPALHTHLCISLCILMHICLPPALPAVEPSSGRIVIDGLDTSSIGLYDLRSRLALVPQASSRCSGHSNRRGWPAGWLAGCAAPVVAVCRELYGECRAISLTFPLCCTSRCLRRTPWCLAALSAATWTPAAGRAGRGGSGAAGRAGCAGG